MCHSEPKERCDNCVFYIPDKEQPRCAVMIWDGGERFKGRYTKPESWCALYERHEKSKDESDRL